MTLLRSLIKSIIYRIITICLGFLVTYLVTGSIQAALSIGLATEAVQFGYYFAFESVWSYYDEKRLRAEISAEFREREIDVKLTLGALVDMAKEFSQIDTFIPEVYNSIKGFFDRMLENEKLSQFHEEFEKYRRSFETTHKDRGFDTEESNSSKLS